MKFIAGTPKKPATNRLAGSAVDRERWPDLLDEAAGRITTMRSAMVMASAWSWVT